MNLLKKSRQSIYVGRLCNIKKKYRISQKPSWNPSSQDVKVWKSRQRWCVYTLIPIHSPCTICEKTLVLQVSKDQRRNQSVFGPVRALRECTCTLALKESKQKSVRQNPINEKCALWVNEPSSCALMRNNCQRTMKWAERECAQRQGVGRNTTLLFFCVTTSSVHS